MKNSHTCRKVKIVTRNIAVFLKILNLLIFLNSNDVEGIERKIRGGGGGGVECQILTKKKELVSLSL